MRVLLLVILAAHLIGIVTAGHALLARQRSPEGAVAWLLALVGLPWIAVPAYWVFGRFRFAGYRTAREPGSSPLREAISGVGAAVEPWRVRLQTDVGAELQAVERLVRMPFLGGNGVELLVDGPRTFDSLFEGIESARSYLLVQFYTVRDDWLGRKLSRHLQARAREGVQVLFLYDRVGSYALPQTWVRDLVDAGVEVRRFESGRRRPGRFQINFRNHRKVMVADGRVGWLGGTNVSAEFLDGDPVLGRWRDTHLRIEGPAVLGLQLSFLEDWYWMTGQVPELSWTPVQGPADRTVLVLPSGPADEVETASLLVQHAIHNAHQRIWIASPYFIPDEGVMSALELAVFRGVEVRVLVPRRSDFRLVDLARFAFMERLLAAGIQVEAWEPGFYHGKTILVDDVVSAVGTVNFDNRSFRLNFEITGLVVDRPFAARVAAMLERDFEEATPFTLEEVAGRPVWFRVLSRAAHLVSPLL